MGSSATANRGSHCARSMEPLCPQHTHQLGGN
jgi:hypothetical protein